MRNLIFLKEMCKENDTATSDSEDSSIYSSHIENRRREIMNLGQLLKNKISKNESFYSFEVISMRKSHAFYQRLLLGMDKYSPLFYSLTWHNETVSDNNSYLPLDIIEYFPSNTLLHLPAKSLTREDVISILKKALAYGIINIFALQGDSLSEDGDFKYATDLIVFIRQEFGDIFCICVAGYPQMHPKSTSKELDLYHLRMKVEAGADFIITQMIFESQIFIDFVKDCRKIGIQIPIISGIFVPTGYKCLERMANICKLDVPTKIKNDLIRMKNDDEATSKFIIELIVQIITDIIKSGTTCGFHLFTFNRLSLITKICGRMDFCNQTI